MRDKNVRVRGDLVPVLERRAAVSGRSLNAYVTDVLAAHVHPVEERGFRPPGLTELAQDLVRSAGSGTVWIVCYGGLPPRLALVAGTVLEAGPTHLEMNVYGSDRKAFLFRAELSAWWPARHQDMPVPEIREALNSTLASPLHLVHLPL